MTDILYTGKERGVTLPSGERIIRAQESLGDFITKAETLKYQTFKQNEQEFLKNSNIDPAFFISTANQKTQAGLLDGYNKKWSAKFKASGYNLPIEDKQNMIAEKNYIIIQQQKMQADQDLWQQHRNMIMQNPTKYDVEEWSQFDKQYRTTGEYPLVAPPIAARSIDMALEDNPIVGNEQVVRSPLSQNGLPGIVETTYSGTEQQARERVKQVALMDKSFTKDLARQFTQLDEATKLKYLDISPKDGTISPEEAKDFNPIIKWAQDTKWQSALKKNEGIWKRTTASTTTQGAKTKVAGAYVNISPGERVSGRTYEKVNGKSIYNSDDSFSFGGNATLYGIPTEGARMLTGGWPGDVDPGSVNARLVLYDAQKHVFLIETTIASESAMTASKVLLEVPEKSISQFENIPLNDNGKQVTIGDYLKKTPTTVDKWSKYKVK